MDEKYMCLKTYTDEHYGTDFFCGKVYDYKNGYMHSTENGTDVEIGEVELNELWKKVG